MSEDELVFKPQVPREHYFRDYDTKKRFISYWYQINEVLRTNPENVLEIGVGNKTVSNYLKNMGIDVTTVDIDPGLEPDYVCSVTEMSDYFEKDSFDTILCAEVLEHLPFEYFEPTLREISAIAKNFVIISLPYFGIKVGVRIKIPLFKEKSCLFRLSYPFKEHEFNGEHYWEVGKKGYSLRLVSEKVSNIFRIDKTYLISEDPYHMMFVLRGLESE